MWKESLKRMKAESGMTTAEIAAKSGIPEPTLEKLFAGVTKDPKLPTMQKLVHFFGYTLDDLYGGKENPPAPAEPEQRVSLEKTEEFLISLGLIERGFQLTDRDLEYLGNIMRLLDMWLEERSKQ